MFTGITYKMSDDGPSKIQPHPLYTDWLDYQYTYIEYWSQSLEALQPLVW